MSSTNMLREALGRRIDELTTGLGAVEVAVIDSGVDASHPDLRGRVSGAFRIDCVQGKLRPIELPVGDNNDGFGHGTAVASIVTRMAQCARIVDIRVLGATQSGAGAALIEGMRVALARRCPVVNMSLAATAPYSQSLMALCDAAYRQGQVVVASKRNMPLADNGYPAEFSSCVAVDCERFESPYELRYRGGMPIEFVAHGEDVLVAAPGGGYTTKTGTSFATPAVSAMCALLLGAFPGLRPFEIKSLLRDAAGACERAALARDA